MLIDTSGWLCLIHKGEAWHSEAVEIYNKASVYLTTNYILAEFIPLAKSRGFPREESLALMRRILFDELIETIWIGERLHSEAMELLEARLDKNYSLCDAVSFILMRERGLAEALTTDKHFEQEGFVRLLK